MEMYKFAKKDLAVSRLGMGLMRLPTKDNVIDYPAAEAMIDKLMAKGVTYYDTAWFYHNHKSEDFTKKALVSRYPRDKFTIATKLPLGEVKTPEDIDRIFDTQKANLGVDYVDFYLLHGIGYKGWEHFLNMNGLDFFKRKRESGEIRHFGFSFHSAKEEAEKILAAYDWDFMQPMMNYYDFTLDSKTIYDTAVAKGVPVIAMEPIRGGALARPHNDVVDIFKAAKPDASVASWALRWCATMPGVAVVLSGISTMEQVDENLALFETANPLSDDELKVIDKAVEALNGIELIPCTECNYCNKCPQKINIKSLFSAFNEYQRFAATWTLSQYLKSPAEEQATACINCGVCEAACPQKIKITEMIQVVHNKALKI